jgi:hypothetical protein
MLWHLCVWTFNLERLIAFPPGLAILIADAVISSDDGDRLG